MCAVVAVTVFSGCTDGATPTAESEQSEQDSGLVTVEFTQQGDEEDCITPDICLWRRPGGGPLMVGREGPLGEKGRIEWGCGKCDSNISEWFPQMGKPPVKDACFDGSHDNVPGTDTCLHLIAEDQYWDVHWLAWGSGGGGFSYIRSSQPRDSQ